MGLQGDRRADLRQGLHARFVVAAGSGAARAAGLLLACALASCGGGRPTATAEDAGAQVSASAGQVAPAGAASVVTFYAASRLADQASFGATPELVAQIRAKGIEGWVDEQLALPFTPIDFKPAEAIYAYPDLAQLPASLTQYPQLEFGKRAMSAPDQLRHRLAWAFSQYLTVAIDGQMPTGGVVYLNVLAGNALGNYRQMLLDIATNRLMGNFLNNDQNRPKSTECPSCAPNENFARELMQLFSIGLVKLNPDGTPQRDNRGRLLETYKQTDVEQLARMLTGWTTDPDPPNRPARNGGNWTKPMVPSSARRDRDSGEKLLLGKTFPAGQPARKDLEDAVDLLMAHPNVAPFVVTRLIQHLVKSDPTPAYVGRVAAKFVDNGSGQRGDLKAVVKAILLDPEARAADNPASARGDEGKIREPMLHRTAYLRGLGCTQLPKFNWGGVYAPSAQFPFVPTSVFSFYAPYDRAPGSNLLAPEQKLMINVELRERISQHESVRKTQPGTSTLDYSGFGEAGCQLEALTAAFTQSPAAYVDLLSQRYFRGAMPPTLRSTLQQLMQQRNPPWNVNDPNEGALRLLGFALTTPYFGAIQ